MMVDRESVEPLSPQSGTIRSAVCVVGAGIAGLALAHRLMQRGLDVVLLEAGGATQVPAATVTMPGRRHPGLAEPPSRAFGGTSLRWGGQLLRPTPEDLAGWPIELEELTPYLEQAERLLRVDALPYDGAAFFAALATEMPALLRGFDRANLRLSKWTPFGRRNLAKTLGRELERSANVRVFTGVAAIEVLRSHDGASVQAVIAQRADGQALRFEATHFVLAAGTLETVRLLLASGFARTHPAIGHNVHDHLTVTAAAFSGDARRRVLAAMAPWVHGSTLHGSTLHSLKLEASDALRATCGLLPVLAHLVLEEDPGSGIGLLRSMMAGRQAGRKAGRKAGLQTSWADALRTLPVALADGLRLVWHRGWLRRRYVSASARVRLQVNAVQQTPTASRITLTSGGDAVFDWKITDRELQTLCSFPRYLRRQFERTGMSGIAWNDALFERKHDLVLRQLQDARHLMGGACMGDDAATSVVDGALAVHGVANLSIASAAVFPSGGPQLPGLLLMALSLRLGDRLGDRLGGRLG